jgi:hypothetical protein
VPGVLVDMSATPLSDRLEMIEHVFVHQQSSGRYSPTK